MANEVFANGREVSCKKADGKSICAFPDVCMTPPENPATPPGVPVPYPNTGMAKDMTSGSKKVNISGKEVMLKNKSYFKKSIGNEAGCAVKKGIVTSVNRGKVYFISWSMDVKVEGKNVVRHLDMTTHNHASPISNTAPWTYADRMAMASGAEECDGDRKKVKDACDIDPNNPDDMKKSPNCPDDSEVKKAEKESTAAKAEAMKKPGGKTTSGNISAAGEKDPDYMKAKKKVKEEYENLAKNISDDKCQEALKCFLSPQDPSRCCPKQTPHHVIPASAILKKGTRGSGEMVLESFPDYKSKKAPCVCVTGPNADTATHKKGHNSWADYASSIAAESTDLKYKDGTTATGASVISYEDGLLGAMITVEELAPHCEPSCIEAQINHQHIGKKEAGEKESQTKIRRTMDDDHLRTGSDTDF